MVPMAGSAECEWLIADNCVEECRRIANRKLGISTHDKTSQQVPSPLINLVIF
jgi:hypothetical protein